MKPRHHRPDRDVEDLRRVLVAEIADVDEYDHVTKVVRYGGKRRDDVVLREPLDDAFLVARTAVGLREPVVQEIVVRLETLHRRRALRAAPAVDVQVRQDAQQPGTQIRAGLVRAPAAKGPRVRLLDEVFGLFARAGEMARD